IKQNRVDDAYHICSIIKSVGEIFEMWDYNTYASYFNLYSKLKDEENTIRTLEKLLLSSSNMWDISNTKLYSHINPKNNSIQDKNIFHQCIINLIKNDPDGNLHFIEDKDKLNELLKCYL
ncbi:MAG: hypothetical protein RR838_13675, partial [Clostridium sp.]